MCGNILDGMEVLKGSLPSGFEKASSVLVKRNARRSVWCCTLETGERYYVKADMPQDGIFAKVKNILHVKSKSESEYESWEFLSGYGIRTPEYTAVLRGGAASALVTRELSDFIPSDEFMYRVGFKDEYKRMVFTENLRKLTETMLRGRVSHPDFHAGNLMVNCHDTSLALIDLYGIKRAKLFRDPVQVLHIFSDFADMINLDEVIPDWAGDVRYEAVKKIMAQWPKRSVQILRGGSKFCRTDADGLIIRNTPWYSECDIPLESLLKAPVSHTTARQMWLNSFLAVLLKRYRADIIPLAWRWASNEGEKDTLYFPPEGVKFFTLQESRPLKSE